MTHQLAGVKDFREHRFFVLRSAAHAEAGGLEADVRRVELRLRARFRHALLDGADQLGAALRRADVIAGAALPHAEHAAGFVADQRGGVGLPTVNA